METDTRMNVVAPAALGSLRGEEVASAVDDTLLRDALKRNGEDHLFDKIMELSVHVEDDPSVIFGWQDVGEYARAIQTARAQAGAPSGAPLPADPLGLPATLTARNFKEAVLDYARIHGDLARLETTCLPCSLAQSMQVTFKLGILTSTHGSNASSPSRYQLHCRSHSSTCRGLARIL